MPLPWQLCLIFHFIAQNREYAILCKCLQFDDDAWDWQFVCIHNITFSSMLQSCIFKTNIQYYVIQKCKYIYFIHWLHMNLRRNYLNVLFLKYSLPKKNGRPLFILIQIIVEEWNWYPSSLITVYFSMML